MHASNCCTHSSTTASSPWEKVKVVRHVSNDNRVTGIVPALRRDTTPHHTTAQQHVALTCDNSSVPPTRVHVLERAPDSDTPSRPPPPASQPVSPYPHPPIGRRPPPSHRYPTVASSRVCGLSSLKYVDTKCPHLRTKVCPALISKSNDIHRYLLE